MFSRQMRRWWIVVLLLLIASGVFLNLQDESENTPRLGTKSERHGGRAEVSSRASRSRYRAPEDWQRAVETLFGSHEAKRSRILSRKETVDSEPYLLGVEPPSADEIRTIRERLDGLLAEIAPENRASVEAKLAKLIQEYDPYGDEGRRVIQIDVPDEPNGRLTGFTCQTTDFTEINERFLNGEMTDLKNLRGYAASYAGMPLTRFDALIVTDDVGK